MDDVDPAMEVPIDPSLLEDAIEEDETETETEIPLAE